MAMESVFREPTTDWRSIRSILLWDSFIPTIIKFSTEDITADARDRLRRDYLSKEDYNFEAVNRASQACGPLVKWVIAQLNYADMLNRVDSLQREMKMLEVECSRNLLTSLADEKEKWEAGSETFKSQMSTITGDVLLTSAFMACGGHYDQQFNVCVLSLALAASHHPLPGRPGQVEYLSNPERRLCWQANALPADDLCTENATMIFNCYPTLRPGHRVYPE